MNKFVCYLCMSVLAIVLTGGERHDVKAQSLPIPSLTEIVFMGLRPASALIPEQYPQDGQPCVRRYLAAVAPDSYLWRFEVPSSSEKAVSVRKRNLVEQMVTILGREVRTEADAFAAVMPLLAEWEGMSEGPLQEADFLGQWLQERPGATVAPFLYLLEAHRLRAAYEAALTNHRKDLRPVLAGRYREALSAARSSTNPLILCLAEDLEAQPFVYLGGQGRPAYNKINIQAGNRGDSR